MRAPDRLLCIKCTHFAPARTARSAAVQRKRSGRSGRGQNGQIGCCATQDRADWRAHQLLGRQSPDTTPERATRPGQCGNWTQNVPAMQARPSPASALGLVAELSNAAPLRTMLIAIVRRGASRSHILMSTSMRVLAYPCVHMSTHPE